MCEFMSFVGKKKNQGLQKYVKYILSPKTLSFCSDNPLIKVSVCVLTDCFLCVYSYTGDHEYTCTSTYADTHKHV